MDLPWHLSDTGLTAAVVRLAHAERGATTRLLAHLAEFDTRQLHLAAGFPSLFEYCCEVLHLSEQETYNRIEAARAARRFPIVLDALAEGTANLTTVRLLAPHLGDENHGDLLDAAAHLNTRQVKELIAERFPRPDIVASVRKLPAGRPAPVPAPLASTLAAVLPRALPKESWPRTSPTDPLALSTASVPLTGRASTTQSPSRPAVVAPLAPGRYEIRFTASAGTRDKLRVAQDLLRHAIPTGDAAEIIDRALTLLIEDVGTMPTKPSCSTVL